MAVSKQVVPPVPRLQYGDRWVEDFLPDRVLLEGRLVPLQTPEGAPPLPDVARALVRSLDVSSTPDLVPSLKEWLATAYKGGDVAVIVDDYARPCEHQRQLLPGVLDWLLRHGVARDKVAIVIAGATHRDPKPAEYPYVFGDTVWPAWEDRIFMHHDREDLERLGAMPDGTPVELNGRAARSEVIVSLSDLDYHYFAGVSGGPKQLVPGIAGRALTTADHLRMFGELGFAPNVDMGILDGNPVYEYKRHAVRTILDALKARGTFVYAVICVLNPHHQIVALEGGEVLTLHRKVRPALDKVYVSTIPRLADIAIVSARHLGINVYQAGKAINASARAVKPGGTVVCLSPSPDGFGNEEFRNLMKIAAPILQEAEARIAKGADPRKEGGAAIDRALRAVQDVVMKDFKIGKQKPVDLLVQYRRTGWGNLWLLCDGLTDEDRKLLPFRYVGHSGEDPSKRLRAWVDENERKGNPTYLVVDDPTYWIRPKRG
jgi:nickel-dependent lactate racemase